MVLTAPQPVLVIMSLSHKGVSNTLNNGPPYKAGCMIR